ncbi:MAG: adenylate/guanylate cyclase domain-containing protein [Pseudomonadota bacterium]
MGWRWLIALASLSMGMLLQWQSDLTPVQRLDMSVQDAVIRWHASDAPDHRIVVVDIDEISLNQVGQWPWRRSVIADLTEHLLSDYRAKAVALDFVLPLSGDADGDKRLKALSMHAPLVLAQAFDYVPRTPSLRVGALAEGWQTNAVPPSIVVIPAAGYIGNQPSLSKARCVGNIGLIPDNDGAIRRLPVLTGFDGRLYEPLSIALARCSGNYPALPHTPSIGNVYPHVVPQINGFWTLPYRRSWSAYTVVSAADVLQQRLPAAMLEGKLVLVGSSSFGLGDRVVTPIDRSTAGVLVHASALSELLDQVDAPSNRQITDLRWLSTFWIAGTVLASALFFWQLPALWSVGLVSLSSLGWLLLVILLLPPDARFSPTAPLLTNLLLLAVAIPYEWRQSQLYSNQILKTFRHYVAQPVLDKILQQPQQDLLAPRFLRVTTLIADMQGYAGLVENASLKEAVALTRDFLDCITRPVLEHDGTLDKYTGDGLMSFWGAPLPTFDHADKALDAALAMVAAVQLFNRQRTSQGKPALRVRIGIDSGLAVAGDLGTPFRGAYTAVGDSVNVASRLQELARDLPYDVVVGPGTAREAQRHSLRRLGEISLRGRKKSMEIFTPKVLV